MGKTTELIKMSHENGGYIVCSTQQEVQRIFQLSIELECTIPFPISFDEFIHHEYHSRGIKEFYIDNVDMLIQYLSDVPIKAITLSKEDQR